MRFAALLVIWCAALLCGVLWALSATATTMTCFNVSGFNHNSTQNTTATMFLNPNDCSVKPGIPSPGPYSTLASTVDKDVPVIGTSTINGLIHLRWTGTVSNVVLNTVPVDPDEDHLLAVGSNTITFENSTYGKQEITLDIVSGQRTIDAIFDIVAPPPIVTGVSPSSAGLGGGPVITITGTNFTSATSVTFGGTEAVSGTLSVDSSTSITATAPPGVAGMVDVVVTTYGGTNTTPNTLFTYAAGVPTVTSVSPTSVSIAGGTVITIKGTDFTAATAVSVDGVNIAAHTIVDDETITLTTPAHAAGTVKVQVTAPGGSSDTSTTASEFDYRDAPVVSSISPASGPVAGSTMVTITGSGFTDATAVKIGTVDALAFTVDSDTQISATTPAGTIGTASVEVTTAIGTNAANTLFTYFLSTVDTPRLIATFMHHRALNLLNSQPDITRFIDGTYAGGGPLGNLQLNANADGYNLTFTSSLGRIWSESQQDVAKQSSQPSSAQINSTKAYPLADVDTISKVPANDPLSDALTPAQEQGYDVWVQMFGVETHGQDTHSNLWVGYIGGHTFISPNLLIGAVAQLDWAKQTGPESDASVEGFGWMIGPYLAARLPGQSLTFEARAAWGKSNNDISPDGTYTDEFETQRWLVNAKLSGAIKSNNWIIQPVIEVSYFEETQASYVDGMSTIIDEQTVSMGELRFGPTFTTQLVLDSGLVIRPRFGISGVWNFGVNNAAAAAAASVTSNDLRARLNVGFSAIQSDRWSLDVSGFYDGIGTEKFHSYGGTVRLSVPLN